MMALGLIHGEKSKGRLLATRSYLIAYKPPKQDKNTP